MSSNNESTNDINELKKSDDTNQEIPKKRKILIIENRIIKRLREKKNSKRSNRTETDSEDDDDYRIENQNSIDDYMTVHRKLNTVSSLIFMLIIIILMFQITDRHMHNSALNSIYKYVNSSTCKQ